MNWERNGYGGSVGERAIALPLFGHQIEEFPLRMADDHPSNGYPLPSYDKDSVKVYE